MQKEKVIIYSLKCDHCITLEKMLDNAGIVYDVCDDFETMKAKRFAEVPMLEVDGKILNFAEAAKWVNSYNK